jgi:hypothetical protein
MPEYTPQQKRKLEKLAKVMKDKELGILEYLFEVDEKVDELLPDMKNVISQIKGEKGSEGEQGVKGDKGDKGMDGKDGRDGKDGKNGIDGKNGANGKNGIDGMDGKDGSPDTAQDIANKLNLEEGIIEQKVIKGLENSLNTKITEGIQKGGGSGGIFTYVDGVKRGKLNTINFKGSGISYSKINGLDTIDFSLVGGLDSITSPLSTLSLSSSTGDIEIDLNLAHANTWLADQSVPDLAYNAITWNGSLVVPTRNAIRDKIESLVTGVSSVSNSDGTMIFSPTTGAVVGSINQSSPFTWTAGHIFSGSTAPTFQQITAGSVMFAGTGGLVSQNNSGFFFNTATNQLRLSPSGTAPTNARLWLRQPTDGAEILRMDRGNYGDDGYGFNWYVDDQGSFPSLRVRGGLNDTIFNVGDKFFGAGGIGGSGIYFANWVNGRGTQFSMGSNVVDFVGQGPGSITFVNDTVNSSKRAGVSLQAYNEDLYREAMGFEILTNQTPSTPSYPTAGFYVSSEQITYPTKLIVGGDNGQTHYNAQGYSTTDAERVILGSNTVVQDTTLATLGADLVTNGSFTGNATGWTLGTGWAYNSNNVAKSSDGTGTLTQAVTTVVGQRYSLRISFGAYGSTTGTATVTITGGTTLTMAPKLRSVARIYEYTFTARSTTSTITITPTNTSRFTLDDIGLRAVTKGNLTVVGRTIQMGGQNDKVRVVTAAGAVTVTNEDYIVVVNKGTGAATTVNLPASPATGDVYIIKDGKGDALVNNITITPAAGNIDGAGTSVVNINYQSATVVYNGTEWNVI